MDTAFQRFNDTPKDNRHASKSQENLLIRIGLLMCMIIILHAMTLVFVGPINWHYHFFNIVFHGVCLLLSIVNLPHSRAQWSKFLPFLCFTSYIVVSCHLWPLDTSIGYMILLELFFASLVFSHTENRLFIILTGILLASYLYVQVLNTAVGSANPTAFDLVGSINQIILAVVSVVCITYLRFMRTEHRKREDSSDEKRIEIINRLIPARFQHNLWRNTSSHQDDQYDTDKCTVVSVDIVNSTQLMKSMGDLNAQQTFNKLFQLVDDVVTKDMAQNNARRIKTNGDQYLLAVGYDSSTKKSRVNTSDSACHAIELALKINDIFLQFEDCDLSVRIGIASGIVYSGIHSHNHPVHDIWGETVVRCTRLEKTAFAGELIIDETTYNAIKSTFSFAFEHQYTTLKGIGETHIYRAKTEALQRVFSTAHRDNTV